MNNRTWLNTFRSGMCCNNSDNAPTPLPPLVDSMGERVEMMGRKGNMILEHKSLENILKDFGADYLLHEICTTSVLATQYQKHVVTGV